MSNEILIENALKRQEAFKNLEKYLQTIKETAKKLDPKAEVYLFGSVAQKSYNYSSDIDVLIITDKNPAEIHAELWKAGIREPFQIHIQTKQKAQFFLKTTKHIIV
ncbi:MAG: nucleotidyltransferase domain-containing protein [Candidatus Methanomethyliales bacterium]|nr:nucleotidyltransferase domain-containing protein [Candidatus Methanomethylicales archaeon]